jgi:hypothetical protein
MKTLTCWYCVLGANINADTSKIVLAIFARRAAQTSAENFGKFTMMTK